MKNRIRQLFETGKDRILSVYFTAGFPRLDDTMKVLTALQGAGADIAEIGMPYSDPVADGPTIQASNKQALDNGMSLRVLFEQISDMRRIVSMPVVLMGYVNPILQYGVEKFCADSARAGVDGVIIPDLPRQEYEDLYKPHFDAAGLYNISLITPQTSPERIREIDAHSRGFIYMVSTSSTTGSRSELDQTQMSYFERVRRMQLKNPLLIGFGISDAVTFDRACHHAHGAIIGSAFISRISDTMDIERDVQAFIAGVKGVQT